MWTEKYKPKTEKDLIHVKEIEKIKKLIKENKHFLIYGQTGIGKTSTIQIIAKELGLELMELNASDIRDKEHLENIIGNFSKQQSLFKKDKLILIDEINETSSKDRGFISSLTEILKTSKFPIILVVDNPWDSSLYNLRKNIEMIELKKPSPQIIYTILKTILEKENITFLETDLKRLSHHHDVRSCINDLQLHSIINKELNIENIDERNVEESIFNALKLIFKSKDFKLAHNSLDNVKEDLNSCMLWIDENLPLEYKNQEDIANAYEKLSKADIFRGRITKWQYYRFLVYQNILMTSGVALAKKEKYNQFTNYKPISRILKIWRYKQKNLKKNAISEKIALKIHASANRVLSSFNLYKDIITKNNLFSDFKLTEEEIEYLKT